MSSIFGNRLKEMLAHRLTELYEHRLNTEELRVEMFEDLRRELSLLLPNFVHEAKHHFKLTTKTDESNPGVINIRPSNLFTALMLMGIYVPYKQVDGRDHWENEYLSVDLDEELNTFVCAKQNHIPGMAVSIDSGVQEEVSPDRRGPERIIGYPVSRDVVNYDPLKGKFTPSPAPEERSEARSVAFNAAYSGQRRAVQTNTGLLCEVSATMEGARIKHALFIASLTKGVTLSKDTPIATTLLADPTVSDINSNTLEVMMLDKGIVGAKYVVVQNAYLNDITPQKVEVKVEVKQDGLSEDIGPGDIADVEVAEMKKCYFSGFKNGAKVRFTEDYGCILIGSTSPVTICKDNVGTIISVPDHIDENTYAIVSITVDKRQRQGHVRVHVLAVVEDVVKDAPLLRHQFPDGTRVEFRTTIGCDVWATENRKLGGGVVHINYDARGTVAPADVVLIDREERVIGNLVVVELDTVAGRAKYVVVHCAHLTKVAILKVEKGDRRDPPLRRHSFPADTPVCIYGPRQCDKWANRNGVRMQHPVRLHGSPTGVVVSRVRAVHLISDLEWAEGETVIVKLDEPRDDVVYVAMNCDNLQHIEPKPEEKLERDDFPEGLPVRLKDETMVTIWAGANRSNEYSSKMLNKGITGVVVDRRDTALIKDEAWAGGDVVIVQFDMSVQTPAGVAPILCPVMCNRLEQIHDDDREHTPMEFPVGTKLKLTVDMSIGDWTTEDGSEDGQEGQVTISVKKGTEMEVMTESSDRFVRVKFKGDTGNIITANLPRDVFLIGPWEEEKPVDLRGCMVMLMEDYTAPAGTWKNFSDPSWKGSWSTIIKKGTVGKATSCKDPDMAVSKGSSLIVTLECGEQPDRIQVNLRSNLLGSVSMAPAKPLELDEPKMPPMKREKFPSGTRVQINYFNLPINRWADKQATISTERCIYLEHKPTGEVVERDHVKGMMSDREWLGGNLVILMLDDVLSCGAMYVLVNCDLLDLVEKED